MSSDSLLHSRSQLSPQNGTARGESMRQVAADQTSEVSHSREGKILAVFAFATDTPDQPKKGNENETKQTNLFSKDLGHLGGEVWQKQSQDFFSKNSSQALRGSRERVDYPADSDITSCAIIRLTVVEKALQIVKKGHSCSFRSHTVILQMSHHSHFPLRDGMVDSGAHTPKLVLGMDLRAL